MNRRRYSRIQNDEAQRIVDLYEDGHTLTDIAAAVGRPRESVTQYLERAGEHVRLPHKVDERTIDKALDWYQRGYSMEAIVAHFGISDYTIYYHIRKRGIPHQYPQMARRQP